jgi:hypothetical protein
MTPRRAHLLPAAALLLASCASEPPRYSDVLELKANHAAQMSGLPPPGTVWRLDEADLKALSPAPIVPAPPPPRYPPPRPNEPYAPYYGPPPIFWAPGY